MNNSNKAGFYAILRLGRKIVWYGPHYGIRVYGSSSECRRRAIETAESALLCDDGSRLAEELSAVLARW